MKTDLQVVNFGDFIESVKGETKDIYSNSYRGYDGGIINITMICEEPEVDTENLFFVKFNDMEARKYAYKPKSICYDYYGNTELFWTIFNLNNIGMPGDLTEERLKEGIIMMNMQGVALLEKLSITPQKVELFEEFKI